MAQAGCPGCPFCRSQSRVPPACEPLDFPPAAPFGLAFQSELVEGCPRPGGRAERTEFVDMISRCVTSKGLRQFHCPASHFPAVMACFHDAFPQNTAELHRLDSVTPRAHLSSVARFPMVLLHVESLSEAALPLARSHPAVHLFCGVRKSEDHRERDVAVNERFRRWPSLESWMSQSPALSLPCLPTTL